MIIDPVVTATPPGAKVTAGYFKLMNKSAEDLTITGAYSPTISKIEIHLSTIKDDVASMVKQESLIIKAGDSLEFKHGSYHLMLMELSEPLKENDSVDVILITSAGEMLIEMPVKKSVSGKSEHDHGSMAKEDHATMKEGEHGSMAKEEHGSMKEGDHSMMKDGAEHTGDTKVVN